ncbi:alpha-L-rhamnosidase C-terminal domain-containing protein [Streptomyces sp. NPDC087212]|uniref:alpha-L-rhamnosidase C-terminal domain-containing protein n=1 Tax=Streptomyces sp. NPDC087212 TaxID=3365766 RepID=UPI0038169F39
MDLGRAHRGRRPRRRARRPVPRPRRPTAHPGGRVPRHRRPRRRGGDVHHQVVGAQPFFRYVVHDAPALLGAADRIAGLCRDWSALPATGPTAFRETWEGGSHGHGWSATGARDLLVHPLGITPAEPGYDRVRVAPRLGSLEWARGVVPTPHGPVEVHAGTHRTRVDSPVPVEHVSADGRRHHLAPGQHVLPTT